MAEIEILLPTVQYGNVKLRGTPEEFGVELAAPGAIGEMAAVYLNLFSQGFKAGSVRDVEYLQAASQEAEPGDPQAAADRLADGRSPRTVDEANEMAKLVIERELGATAIGDDYDPDSAESSDDAPWNSTVDAKPKPWETGTSAPMKVAEIDWS